MLKESLERFNSLTQKIKEKKEELDILNNSLRCVADEFTISDLEDLTYTEVKEVVELPRNKLSYEKSSAFLKYLKERKEAEFEESKGATFFKQINELEGVSTDYKKELDTMLYENKRAHIYDYSKLWCKLASSYTKGAEFFERDIIIPLVEKGVLEHNYIINCDCGESGSIMTDAVFEEHRKFFELWRKRKEENYEFTDTDIDWIDNFERNHRVWEVGCFECDESKQLDSWSDFDNYTNMYKVKATPDMTYYNK